MEALRAFAVAGLVVWATGCGAPGANSAPGSEDPAAIGPSIASSAPTHSATPSAAEVALPLREGQTFVADLAYDEARDAIWFVGFDGPGHYIFRVDTTSSTVDRWPLPPGSYVGVYVQIKTDSDGVVWVTDNYQIVRFDPATHAATAHTFDLHVAGALPGALTGPNPGTWVSGIGETDGGLLVARNNVPWLTKLDANLREVARIPTPDHDEGAQDLAVIGQTIFLERDEHTTPVPGLDLLDGKGALLASVPGQGGRLEVVGDRVLRHGRDNPVDVPIEWVGLDGSTELVGQGSSAYADPRGGVTLFHRVGPIDQALERVVDGSAVSVLPFEGQVVQLDRCPFVPAPSGATPPPCPKAKVLFHMSDLVTDRDGVTWYVSVNPRSIYRVQL